MEKYSVLMAVYDKEKPEYLRLAIESMLAQSVPPDEFVLVCDGPLTSSLDGVIEQFCGSYPELFQILRLENNQGLGAALNIGLKECRNELVARMDSDDMAVPDRMEKQLAAMEKDPQISVLGGQIGEFAEDPEKIHCYRTVPIEEQKIREFLKFRSPMNHTTIVLRKSHILQAGSYQAIPGFEDYTLWIRLLADGYHMRNIEDMCCRVRADGRMYARRGGLEYFRNTLKMERLLLEKRLVSVGQYRRNIVVRFIGTMLLTPRLRRLIFLTFLRSKGKEMSHAVAEEQRRLSTQTEAFPVLLRGKISGQTYMEQ